MAFRLPRLFGVALLAVLACVLVPPASASAAGELTISPDEADFGEVPSGLSGGRHLTLANTGPDPVQIGEISFEGDADPFSIEDGGCSDVLELAGGESCTLNVTFHAPMDTGDYEALLVVEGIGVDPAVATLTASSLFEGYLVSDVAEVRVGPTPIGATSAPHVVRVRNIGDTPVSISKVDIFGPPSITPFKVVANGCVGVLDPDQECSVEVVFSPKEHWGPGLQGAALFVLYPGQIGVLVPLNGEATLPLAPPSLPPPSSVPGPIPEIRPADALGIALADLTDAVPTLIRGGPTRLRSLPVFSAPSAGQLSLALFGRKGARRLRIGAGTLTFDAPQAGRLRFRLNKKGVALLRRPQRTRIKAVLRFEPLKGTVTHRAVKLVVKAPRTR